ncbi:hypothetical protein ACKWTF_014220 [Chironomus riparius]
MKLLLRLFFVLIAGNFLIVECDELVSAVIPKSAHKDKPYTTFIQVYDLDDSAELAIQFHTINQTYSLIEQGNKTFEYHVSRFGSRQSVNLTSTLFREKKIRGNLIKQCNTQMREIKVEYPRFFIFIQMNKPIYKPGDSVKFRLIVMDKDLVPHQMNNILITITDPYDRVMQELDDLEDNNLGIYTNTYNLSASTLLGDWKMTVVVDKEEKFRASKIIPVQKYALPLFALKVDTSSKHYLPNHKLIISFGAKYSFGEYVTGNAQLVIHDTSDNRTCYSNTYNDITGIETVTLNIVKDLKTSIANLVNFKAIVTFTEPETGTEVIKSTEFSVHNSEEMSIKTVHSNTFTPGLPFNVKVFAKQWNGDKFVSNEPVSVNIKYIHKDKTKTSIHLNPFVEDGVANGEVIVPLDVETFDIECRFISSKVYRKRLKMAKVEQTRNSMLLEYKPERPSFGNDVEIFVSSAYKMEQVLVAIVTKYGVTKATAMKCDDKTACNFKLTITAQMLPKFTVEVFHIKDKDINEHGSIRIETETLGMNHLTMDMTADPVKVKSEVPMTFSTTEDSTIYLLAIDKSLKFLRDGNDVKREEVVQELSAFDGQLEVLLDDMTSWHECTAEEIKRVESGRVEVSQQTSDTFVSSDDDETVDDGFTPDENDVDDTATEEIVREPTEDDLMRQDFPETWIFESFEVEDSETRKSFKVPDTITSWHISAFSVHPQNGLALMDPQELTVKNEFFVKFALPYSIRYKEVLRVDVLVFNYVKSNKPLDVKVTLKNLKSKQFQFVEYEKNGNICKPNYSNKTILIQNVKVTGMGMKKVSFYIRSNPNDADDKSNKIKSRIIQVYAEASDGSGKTYKDRLEKKLKIEPVGVRKFNTEAYTFSVINEMKRTHSEYNVSNSNTNSYCIVNGDFLTDIINLNSGFEIYPGDCLEQRTSKLKGNVQVYKYFQTKKKTQNKDYFQKQYQAIWEARGKRYNYESASGYISYFIDAVVPAMELKLINADIPVIEKELDKLKKAQTTAGSFENFGNFPDIREDPSRKNTQNYFQTAFVLISFLKAQKIVTNSYMDVIDKAFIYLDDESNRYSVDSEGLSIAAYAYALGIEYDEGRENEAKKLLDTIERAKVDYGGNKKCFKIKTASTECHMRHTSYAAMAYLKLNEIDKAMPLIYWMLKEYNFYIYQGYTYNSAILSEPIADATIALGVDVTDFEVALTSEDKPYKKFKFTNKNVNDYHEVPFIPNVNKISMIVEGTGFCTVTRVNEFMVEEAEINNQFSVTITPKASEGIVNVCASYSSTESNQNSILNVVYEVEFPTGYIFAGVVNEQSHRKDIKQIEERKGKTLAMIYYNDFENDKTYCVDIKAMKAHDVKNPGNAGVKVYDFNDKRNVAVEFYEFKSSISC